MSKESKSQNPNSVGASGIKGCKCDFRTYMLGDGCDKCNPALALEYARENIEELEREIAEQQAILTYLMDKFDNEEWNCICGHSEDTASMDSAIFLREYLKHNSTEELNNTTKSCCTK